MTKRHQIAGKWKQFTGNIKKQWGGLTHDECMKINGHREVLAGTIRERRGATRLEAKKHIDEWVDGLKASSLPIIGERFNMTNKSEAANKLVGNPQLSAALTQMSEAELKRLLNSIEALRIDLSRLVTLLNVAEPIEVITATQSLLKTLSAEINNILAVKRTKDSRGRLQNWDNEGGSVDYAPVYHLLHRVKDGRRCLIWTDIGQPRC